MRHTAAKSGGMALLYVAVSLFVFRGMEIFFGKWLAALERVNDETKGAPLCDAPIFT